MMGIGVGAARLLLLYLHPRQSLHVQRVVFKKLPENGAARGIVTRQQDDSVKKKNLKNPHVS